MHKFPELSTPRLRLRAPVSADAEWVFRDYAQDREVTRYVTWAPHLGIDQTQEFISDCLDAIGDDSRWEWVIERQSDGRGMGMIGANFEPPRATVGYVLARPHWGQGIGAEALGLVISAVLARPEIFGAWAVCDVENQASARVMEKAGMQHIGILPKYVFHSGFGQVPRDCFCYATFDSTPAKHLSSPSPQPRGG